MHDPCKSKINPKVKAKECDRGGRCDKRTVPLSHGNTWNRERYNIMGFTNEDILRACDHTLLKPEATWDDIRVICEEATEYHTASVCIPPCYVSEARFNFPALNICTVIGFPNGNGTSAAKMLEADDTIKCGANEIDMVINIGMLKAGKYDYVQREISFVKKKCGDRILKVIIETCLLTDEEKIKMCEIVSKSGADFIKTSTGFSTGGATFDDIKLFKEHVAPHVKIKAAGGISSLDDARKFLELGADRLGTSRIVKLVKEG